MHLKVWVQMFVASVVRRCQTWGEGKYIALLHSCVGLHNFSRLLHVYWLTVAFNRTVRFVADKPAVAPEIPMAENSCPS